MYIVAYWGSVLMVSIFSVKWEAISAKRVRKREVVLRLRVGEKLNPWPRDFKCIPS